ncbi:Cysteine proteinase inhibitor 5 [Bienertia sinuspersici]
MSCSASQKKKVGGFEPADPNDPKIIEIATWAVDEYNKEKGTCLKFAAIWKADQQVVSGMRYSFTLKVANGENFNICLAQVYDQPWTNTRRLVGFEVTVNERIAIAN